METYDLLVVLRRNPENVVSQVGAAFLLSLLGPFFFVMRHKYEVRRDENTIIYLGLIDCRQGKQSCISWTVSIIRI